MSADIPAIRARYDRAVEYIVTEEQMPGPLTPKILMRTCKLLAKVVGDVPALLAEGKRLTGERDAARADNARLAEKVARVEALHEVIIDNSCGDDDCCGRRWPDTCRECGDEYPCATVAALADPTTEAGT